MDGLHVLWLLAVFMGLVAADCKRNYESSHDEEEEMPMSRCQMVAQLSHCQTVTDTQVFEIGVSSGRLHALHVRHDVKASVCFNFFAPNSVRSGQSN